ncbi:MAG: hypothetical protein ACYTFG_22590 [Planctomycetota bacterium]|jgi:hypothetical protein
MRYVFLALFVVAVVAPTARASDTMISGLLDWTVGSRAGLEHVVDHPLGFKAHIGMSPFGLITADAFAVIYCLPQDHYFRLNVLLGIPFTGATVTFEGGLVALGGSIEVGYWTNPRVSLNFRIGAGFPFFFERGKDAIRNTQFPLNLWPDLAFTVAVRI